MATLAHLADRFYGWAARWWIIALYFGLVIITFQAIGVFVSAFDAVAEGMSLLEVPTLVVQPGFDPYDWARQYPPEALAIYRDQIQLLDIFFPLAAGLFYGTLLYTLLISLTSLQSNWRALGLLGLGLTLADYIENIGVSGVLRTLEAPSPIFPALLLIGSLLKFAVGVPTILSVLVIALLLLVQRVRNRVQQPA